VAVLSPHRTGFAVGRTALWAVFVFAVAVAVLGALRADAPGPVLSSAQAEAAALRDPALRQALAEGYTRVRTMPLDERTMRVSFFDGPRAVAEAAVRADGRVDAVIAHDGLHARVGSDVGQRPPVLAGLVALFLLATLRLPVRRRENLDALALAALSVPIVLLNERYLELSVLTGAVLLAFLAWRCLRVAAGGPGGGRWMIERLPGRAPVLLAAGAAAALVLLSVPGGLVSDVGYASMAGATRVLDGHLPYGSLPGDGLVHGDTYPLLAYLAYVPAAVVEPVRSGFDGLDGALWVATAFALAAALALARAGGARLALAFLAFPPVMVAASSGSNDAVTAALVAASTSASLTAAAWVKLAPLAALPLWLAGGRRRSLLAAAAVSVVPAGFVLALGGPAGFADMTRAVSFQSERGSVMSLWALVDLPGAQIAFQALVITAIVLAATRAWRDPAFAADPRRTAAIAAALLIGAQLAANHWSPTYLAWLFPLLAVALLAGPATPSRPRAPARSRPASAR
jgi:hypothetical protein